MKNIETLIYNMLTESTGIHFLDSGGDSGRHWQRNQKKSIEDFINEQYETIEKDGDYYYRTLSLFHYLTEGLELDHICNEFNEINNNIKEWNSDIPGVSQEAEDYLYNNYEFKSISERDNTYNYDSDLSQDIILQFYEIDSDNRYVLIQIHNGADARGGHTDAKLFKCSEPYIINPYIMEHLDQLELEELYNEKIPS